MFGNYFTEHSVKVIPRYDNTMADSLAIGARKFKTPTAGKRKYKVDILNRPSIQDNTKYWQFFEDNMQIKRFLELSGEFVNTQIEKQSVDSENFQDVDEYEEGVVEIKKLKSSLRGKDIVQLKIQWKHYGPKEATQEREDVIKQTYPLMFQSSQ